CLSGAPTGHSCSILRRYSRNDAALRRGSSLAPTLHSSRTGGSKRAGGREPGGKDSAMIPRVTSLLCTLGLLLPALAPVASAQMSHTGGKGHMAQTRPAAPARPAQATPAAPAAPKVSKQSPAADYTPNVRFRLRTELAEGKMAFVGVGGDIRGIVEPRPPRKRG